MLAAAALILIVGIAFLAGMTVVKNVLYVCQPNEVLIFSGRSRDTQSGRVGYRIIKGGRTLRVPLLETVDRMDLTNMTIELSVRGAYSKGGIPLTVQGIANIKVPGEEPMIHATLERLLGYTRQQIMQLAQLTLEGNLRGVLAGLTPEQVNTDKEAFAGKLTEEAEHDLSRLGLVLDTLKIQNVSDEVGYLQSIGRMRSAKVRQSAVMAEASAQADAGEQKWHNKMQSELSQIDAQIAVARKENDRRIADATTRREAMIAEQRATVQAAIAQAKAELQLQTARIEQVRLKLQAEILQPAEAQRRKAEEDAKGAASRIIEQGRATASVLGRLAAQYRSTGTTGRDVLLLQKLVPMFKRLSEPLGDLRIDKLTVIGGGSGVDGGGSLASKLVSTSEQIRAATGIDVPRLLQEKLGTPERPRNVPPPGPRPREE